MSLYGTTLEKKKRVTVLGLDGATFDVLDPLMKLGLMPNLKKLIKEGHRSPLYSTFPPHTAASWTSFATGVNPGKHGVFEWSKHKGGGESHIVDSSDIKVKTFYELLREQGHTCCLINLPLSTPSRIDGVVIKSFASKYEKMIYPSSMEKVIDISNYRAGPTTKEILGDITTNLENLLDEQMVTVRDLYNLGFDMFFFLLSETDHLQHSKLSDIEQALKDGEITDDLRFYQKIDNVIGEFSHMTKESNLIIISDHGFQTFNKIFYPNEWLVKNGFAKRTSKRTTRIKQGAGNPVVKLVNALWPIRGASIWLYNLLEPIMPLQSNVKLRAESQVGYDIDLDNSLAICPTSEVRGIYLNDERFGNAIKKKNREKIITDIQKKLEKDIKIKTYKGSEFYRGKYTPLGPDILLDSSKLFISRSMTNKIFKKGTCANHHKKGILIIRTAEGHEFDERRLMMWDVPATALGLMGYNEPEWMDGKCVIPTIRDTGKTMEKSELSLKIKKIKGKLS